MTRFAATALCLSLLFGLAPLTLADGTDLTTSASVSSEPCSADYLSATVNIKITVTSTASGAPATLMVSNNDGATFTPIGTIYVWSQSGRDKSAEVAFQAVVPSNTTTKFEVCAAQPGSNGNPNKSSCANLSIDPICASYIPRTTIDYTASGADFLVVGDWGNQADYTDMVNVATQMNTWASNYNSKFVLSLGVNFFKGGIYNYDGVQSINGLPTSMSVNDPKFSVLWKDVYLGTALAPLPWWLDLGNHDWYTLNSPFYEMQYQDPNWNLPDYFYVQRFALPQSKHATIIHLDTDLLFYGYSGKSSTDMATNFTTAGWLATANTSQKQLAWIDKALETANQDDYVIVVGEHPIFTCGSDVTGSVHMTDLYALIQKWKPTAYMNAHHHTLAYYLDGSTLEIQSGSAGNVDAACAPVTPPTCTMGGTVCSGYELPNTYGFAHAQLTGSDFSIEFVKETGVSWKQTSLGPRTPVTGVTATLTPLPGSGDPSIHKQF
jgi:hypothetical protein